MTFDEHPSDIPSAPTPARTSTDGRLATLTRLVRIADREGGNDVRTGLAMQIRFEFSQLVQTFDQDMRSIPAAEGRALADRMRAAIVPVMRRAENGWRWFEKPRGYAGDFATLARMYADEARGATAVDRLLDRCFLDFPAVCAVQNRRRLLMGEIKATIRVCADRGVAHVSSLACGPARELFDLYGRLDDPRVLNVTLVDFDPEALAYCAAEATARSLQDQVTMFAANLIHVAIERRPLALGPQDLVYSIGLIDYLADEIVVKLLDWIHGNLRPGGRVILGNFHPVNPTRAIMEELLDWRLIHREEADMHRLVRLSAFGRWSRIFFEGQGINLFAEAHKE